MHKETIIAVVIGLLFGLMVTVSVYKLQSLNQPAETETTLSDQVIPSASPAEESQDRLSISSPTQGLITSDAEITIDGKTDAKALLVLFAQETQQIYEADATGTFTIPFTLKEGPNFFTLVATNQDGTTFSVDRVVVYEKDLTQL